MSESRPALERFSRGQSGARRGLLAYTRTREENKGAHRAEGKCHLGITQATIDLIVSADNTWLHSWRAWINGACETRCASDVNLERASRQVRVAFADRIAIGRIGLCADMLAARSEPCFISIRG